MPPTTQTPILSEKDQAFIDGLAAKLRQDPAPSGEAKDLKAALADAPAGSSVKWGEYEILKPAEAAAKQQRGELNVDASVDGDEVEAEVEAEAKLLAPVESALGQVQFGGLNIGKLGLGLGLGILSTETLNGVVSPVKLDEAGNVVTNDEGVPEVNWSNVMWKFGIAGGYALFGSKFMGKDATIGAVAYPLGQALGQALPFDRAVAWFVKKIQGDEDTTSQQQRVTRQRQQVHQHQLGAGKSSMAATSVYAPVASAFRR